MLTAHEAYAFSPYAIPTAVTAVVSLAFGAHVLMRRAARVTIAFFVLTSLAALWQATFTMMYLATDPAVALLWAKIAYVFIPFLPPAAYQFAVELLRVGRFRGTATRLGWAAAALFAVLAVTTDSLVVGVRRFWWGYYPRYNSAPSIPFLVFVFGFLVAANIEYARAHPSARGVERGRIRLAALAFAVGCVASVDFLAVYGVPVYPFGFAGVLGYLAIVAYTIRRYDLVPISPSLAAKEIIGTMADVLLVTDREGRIEFANHAAQSLLGYEVDELNGRHFQELIVPTERGEASLRGRSFRDTEYVFRTKSGEPVELTLSVSPVAFQNEAAGAVMIGRDLRERKRSERETRRAVTLLQSTLDSTADGILVIGLDGKILIRNQRFADMWGIPQEVIDSSADRDLLLHLADQLTDPADFLRTLEALHAHPEAESIHVLDFKDGRRFEQYSIGRYLDNAPVRVWSFRDMTARLAAEDALRESEERYRQLFEQNAAGVCVTTFAGEIADCNSTFAAMVGYAPDELTGRNVSDLYDRPAAGAELAAQLRATPALRGVEIELRRRDGQRVWVLANLSVVRTGNERTFHATVVDISDRKRAEAQIEFHAYHDVLTHLPNRRQFEERLALSILASKRHGGTVGVLFLDLDHFKNVNDTLGHTAADELLIEVASRLRHSVRQTDSVARLGGDEFTIILPDLNHPEDAAQVAQKVLDAVAQPITIGGTTIEISASIGVALHPYDGPDVETLLRHADHAMYRAKEAGRNNYQLCTEEMKVRAVERLSLQSRLRKAIYSGQLLLLYQPQVKVATGRIIGAEALVRWIDPERGEIQPMSFIPLAEETQLILPLGLWVLHTACHQVRQWQDQGLPAMRMAVNLSARQFQQHDLVDTVQRAVRDAGIAPELLELEITETTAMQNAEMSMEVLRMLRETGVSVAIDDFGTGYSSLAYLQRLPIHAVKIDRTFIGGIPADSGSATIVGSVIAIARSLGLRVVAEGVETREQLDFLRRRRCNEAQGFYFSRPLTAESLRAALATIPALTDVSL